MCGRGWVMMNVVGLKAQVSKEDERPPWWDWEECPRCKGTGKETLFTSFQPCHQCFAKGGWNRVDVEALAELLETDEGREQYMAEQRRRAT